MKRLKLILLFLAVAMLLGCLVSCGGKKKPTENSTQKNEVTTPLPDSDQIDEPIALMDDFNQYEFRVLTRGSGAYMSDDITGAVDGDRLSIGTYQRNAILAEKYNFDIIEVKQSDWKVAGKTSIMSGKPEYDMWSFTMKDMPNLGIEGYIQDLNDVYGLSLDAPYYDERTNQSVSFANHLFFTTGDLLYMDDLAISTMVFNPSMWESLQCSEIYGKDPYSLVRDGQWTFEVLKTIAATANYDANGDGVNDRYGSGYANGDIFAMTCALGDHVMEKDENDLFVLNQSEKMISDLQAIFNYFNSSTCIKDTSFRTGILLFHYLPMYNTYQYRDAGVAYGMIPAPKANEDAEYYSYVSGFTANCIAIPSLVTDIDITANLIELISWQSRISLTPQLESYLFYKLPEHEDDMEMVNLMKETRAYENAYVWPTGSIYSALIELNNGGGDGIATVFESKKSEVDTLVGEMLKTLKQSG